MDYEIVIRLFLALLLSGLIGMEREKKSRPAGLRTHVLVCVSSTLVMLTSIYIYKSIGGTEPTRLGAQVISGIGLLGAGTIIRQGASIKGLTTAASLWAVACVGLSIGAGFYEGAIIVSIIIYASLFLLRKFEKGIAKKFSQFIISVEMDRIPGKIEEIVSLINRYGVEVKIIDLIRRNEEYLHINITLVSSAKEPCLSIVDEILQLEGINNVE